MTGRRLWRRLVWCQIDSSDLDYGSEIGLGTKSSKIRVPLSLRRLLVSPSRCVGYRLGKTCPMKTMMSRLSVRVGCVCLSAIRTGTYILLSFATTVLVFLPHGPTGVDFRQVVLGQLASVVNINWFFVDIDLFS